MKNAFAAVVLALVVTIAVAGPLAWRVAQDDTQPPTSVPAAQRTNVDGNANVDGND